METGDTAPPGRDRMGRERGRLRERAGHAAQHSTPTSRPTALPLRPGRSGRAGLDKTTRPRAVAVPGIPWRQDGAASAPITGSSQGLE